MLLNVIITALGGVAVLAWGAAVVTIIGLIRYRRPDLSLGRLAVSGHLFFRSDSFRPEAAGLWRRLVTCVGVFLCAVIALAVVAFVSASRPS